jgi:hypothetical protein
MATVCSAPDCGKQLPPATGSRPRLYCDAKCRGRAYAARKASTPEVTELSVAAPPAHDPDSEPTLLDVVRRELVAAERLNTIDGMQAVTLVKRMLDPLSTASAVATLNKELTVVLGRALEGIKKPEPDLLDELEQRRLQKIAQA